MLRALIFGSCLLVTAGIFAQSTKKPNQEKPPSQKEMEELMKQAQKEMDKMSPENKKMMDSLGIKTPSFKNVPQVGDKELAAANAMEGIIIPPKNTKLIATIPTKIFSTTELLSYVKKTNTSVATMIKPEAKKMADMIVDKFKNDKYYGALIASAANGMWVSGYQDAAIYLMGIAIDKLPNADNYNNYAAFLTMSGAAHMAIPVLNKLNSVHKKNSTIYNNLGQAWLQLGDEDKATKFLDSAIKIYAYHPQANYTKCLMLESKDRTAEAIEALIRSMHHSITKTKINKLKELEGKAYKPRGYNIPKVYYSSTFNLGVYTALIPTEYAKTAGRAIDDQWIAFRDQIRQEKDRIDRARNALKSQVEEEGSKIQSKATKQGGIITPPYYQKALERYNSYIQSTKVNLTKEGQEGAAYAQSYAALKIPYSNELKAEQERFSKISAATGDNRENCAGMMPIIEKYLKAINGLNQKYNDEKVRREMTRAYQLYDYATAIALTDAAALKVVLDLKADFLQKLLELKHESYGNIECSMDKKIDYKIKKLPDYDEVNCNIMNVINFPGFGTVVYRCNNASMKIDSRLLPFKTSLTANYDGYVEQASIGIKLKAGDIEAGAQFDKDGNFVKGNGKVSTTVKGIEISASGEVDEKGFSKGSLELGIDGELKFIPEGLEGEAPIEISLKDNLGLGMEIDREGIADFVVKNKVEGDFASNVETDNEVELTPGMMTKGGKVTDPETTKLPLPKAPSVSVSADSRWSVNSGFSVTKGSMSGLKNND